jgi:nucleotide-binding universal stress UspA family protein
VAQDTQAGRWPHAPDHNDLAAPVIVVGLDGSPSSWNAFTWAAGEALRISGKVVAVHVVPLVDTVAAFDVPYDYAGVAQARQQASDELGGEASRRADELGLEVSFVTEHGDAIHALTDVARAFQANLVVVGRSAKAFHRLVGSLSHRLTSRNDAPIVVVVP